jgi:hypothetical protein
MPDGLYIRGSITFTKNLPTRMCVVVLEELKRAFLKGVPLCRACTESYDAWMFEGFVWGCCYGSSAMHSPLKGYLDELCAHGTLRGYDVEYFDVLSVASIHKD